MFTIIDRKALINNDSGYLNTEIININNSDVQIYKRIIDLDYSIIVIGSTNTIKSKIEFENIAYDITIWLFKYLTCNKLSDLYIDHLKLFTNPPNYKNLVFISCRQDIYLLEKGELYNLDKESEICDDQNVIKNITYALKDKNIIITTVKKFTKVSEIIYITYIDKIDNYYVIILQ